MTDAGYVLTESKDLSESPRLRLLPYSSLEGTLTLGESPAPTGSTIEAQYELDDYQLSVRFDAKTDASGKFAIPRVFSQTYNVSRSRGEASKLVTTAPGATARVELRSHYSPITARLELPPSYDSDSGEIASYALRLPTQLANATLPDGILSMSAAQRMGWFDEWIKSPAGQMHSAQQARVEGSNRDIRIMKDGQFRVADVPPGIYNLHTRFLGRVNGTIDYGKPVAGGVYRVTVPQLPYQEAPIDLGVLPIHPDGWVDGVQQMQDIVIPMLDGNEVLLSSFKGKVVLLDFWGVWCGICTTNLPHIQALHDQFGSDPNFAIISLSVDDEPAQIREFLKDHRKPWTIGVLGTRDKAWATKLYSVMGYPTYWLIGADGRVLATGTTTHFLAPLVQNALEAAKRTSEGRLRE